MDAAPKQAFKKQGKRKIYLSRWEVFPAFSVALPTKITFFSAMIKGRLAIVGNGNRSLALAAFASAFAPLCESG